MQFEMNDVLEEYNQVTQENLLLKLQVRSLSKKIEELEKKNKEEADEQ